MLSRGNPHDKLKCTHTEVLEEGRVVAPRAKGRNVEVRLHVALTFGHERIHDFSVHVTMERSVVLSRIPEVLRGVARVWNVESGTLNEVGQRWRRGCLPLRADHGNV